MGDFKDAFGDNPSKTIKQIDTVISALGAASTVAGVVVPGVELVLRALHAFEDDFDTIRRQMSVIQRAFEALGSQLNAKDYLDRMRQLALIVEDARTQRDVLAHHLRTADSSFASQEGLVRNNTQKAVNTLADPAFWLRPLIQDELYTDVWIGTSETGTPTPTASTLDVIRPRLQPPPPAGLPPGSGSPQVVFEWRLALPAYLEVVSIRLMVLRALEPSFPDAFRDELSSIGRRLGEVHDTIVAGMKVLRPPTVPETVYNALFNPDEPSFWDRHRRLYGAVEVYSAEAVVQAWPETEFPSDAELAMPFEPSPIQLGFDQPPTLGALNITPAQQGTYNHFVLRHALRSGRRQRELYNKLALNSLWSAQRTIASMADAADVGHRWSVQEIDDMAARALLGQPSTAPPGEKIRATELVTLLGFPRKGTESLPGRRVGLKLALGAFGDGLF